MKYGFKVAFHPFHIQLAPLLEGLGSLASGLGSTALKGVGNVALGMLSRAEGDGAFAAGRVVCSVIINASRRFGLFNPFGDESKVDRMK